MRSSDVKWKSGAPGCQEDSVTILENFIDSGKDYNIVLTFKLGERLTEMKKYERAIEAYKFGLVNIETFYYQHPK